MISLIMEDMKKNWSFTKGNSRTGGGKVLEIACGTGMIFLELLSEGIDIYGFTFPMWKIQHLIILINKARE